MMRLISCGGAVLVAMALLIPSDALGQSDRVVAGGRGLLCEDGGRSFRCSAEHYLAYRLERDGVAAAMAALDSVAAADPEVRRLGHNYAHAIGLAAYTTAVEVAQVFGACTPAFQSGCYHGVIQSYFGEHAREHGSHLDRGMVEALCDEQRSDPSKQWILFQCVHGLGHGLMMVVENHLPSALEGCDLLGDPWEREVCYGAVFMENVVHVTSPHHAVGRPEAGHHAPAGVGMDHGAHPPPPTLAREEFPPLDPERPLYPCNVLDDRYQQACYGMQTSAILHFNGRDVGAAGRECLRAPEVLISTCFQSLGRDVSALTVQDHQQALRYCELTPEGYRAFCHLGYAKNLIDQTSRAEDGVSFCRLLAAPTSKRACYIGVGEQLWVLYAEPAEREAFCQGVETSYVASCRYGAGLGGPDDLQRPAIRSTEPPGTV